MHLGHNERSQRGIGSRRRVGVLWGAVLGAGWMLGAAAGGARADPLNPLDFSAGGNRVLSAGSYTVFSSSEPPTMTGPGVLIVGTVSSATNPSAVFAFDSLVLSSGVVINVVGSRPVAFLAVNNITWNATMNLSGLGGPGGVGGFGTPGERGAGLGAGGGSLYPSVANVARGNGGGGGGFGRAGGAGGIGTSGTIGTGAGGPANGDLLTRLDVGSGGGGGSSGETFNSGPGGSGGAGGGTVELGALGSIQLSSGAITARGNVGVNGGSAATNGAGGGGGGSGGGVLIHAPLVTLGTSIDASGGNGGSGGFGPSSTAGAGGGGGAGGRVVIQSTSPPALVGIVAAAGAGGPRASGGNGTAQPGAAGGAGTVVNLRAVLTATDLDFGDVPVGSSKTLGMLITNTGDPGTVINGRFPADVAPFNRNSSTGIFSGLRVGTFQAATYTFAPTSIGTFSQTLTFSSNGGPATVTIRGRGVSRCAADFDQSGVANVGDIFSFLSAWFSGCP